MIVDLHSHYPMHLLADDHDTVKAMTRLCRSSLEDSFRAAVLRLANWRSNYPGTGDKPAVTVPNLAASNVRVALSVLFEPFDEIDFKVRYQGRPKARYFRHLLDQIDTVEKAVKSESALAMVAHNHAELAEAKAADKVALVHAVEGGFAIGGTERQIEDNVATLASKGVACITVAHLFFRKVATNAPAVPFLSDPVYHCLFPQPRAGLTGLGRCLIKAMVKHHILIDVTHMSAQAIDETLRLLDALDPNGDVPLIAGHTACRTFGGVQYNISDEHIAAIARRHGVVGLIACEHWMASGMAKPTSFADTMDIICRHIDHIHKVTREPDGDHNTVAFGSDQDGFIKPALPDLDYPAGFVAVEEALVERYGIVAAERICSENALRVLGFWKGTVTPA